MSILVLIDKRWCLTEDKSRVVDETSPDARWLHWMPGDEVPLEEAIRLGVVEEPKRRGRPPGSKNRTPNENK